MGFYFQTMNTKKIIEYRSLLGVTKTATLKELKTIYRNAMKDSHPDTIQDEAERLAAEAKSTEIIAAYHFLVSIAPETLEKDKDEYTRITSSVNIADFYYEKGVLYITFLDGSSFEYFGVLRPIYIKMVNAESPSRFARRHIYNQYIYRSASKLAVAE
jgi:hypothetical protein